MSKHVKHVTGHALKAGVYVHGKRQLAAMGIRCGYRAFFSGDGACSRWEQASNGRVISASIGYPEVADNTTLSRKDADLFAAFTLHELGHVVFTDNTMAAATEKWDENSRRFVVSTPNPFQGQRGRVLFRLWNGIEDGRIEHAVIASGTARNARSMFKRLANYLTASISPEWNPTRIGDAPFALACLSRVAFGNGNYFMRALLARIPEPKRSVYAEAMAACASMPLDRSGSRAALDIAAKFLESWERIDPPAREQDNQTTEGRDNSPEDVEPQGDASGQDAPTPEDEVDEEDEEVLQFMRDLQSAAAEPGEAGSGEEQAAASIFDHSEDEADEGEGESLPEFADDGGKTDYSVEPESPEPDLTDLANRLNAKVKAPVYMPNYAPAMRTDMASWNENGQSSPRSGKQLSKACLPAVKVQLMRLLRAPERVGWDPGAYSGRLDRRRAARILTGQESVFRRRWETPGINTAMEIIIDMSGSMAHWPIMTALQVAYTIASAAEQAGAAVQVSGFTSRLMGDSINERYSVGRSISGELPVPTAEAMSSGYCAVLVTLKSWKRKVRQALPDFWRARKFANGGTPDYSAVRTAAEQISTRPEERKIILVLTDGMGQVADMAELTANSERLLGVTIIGIGIGMTPSLSPQEPHPLSRAYAVHAYCPRYEDIADGAMRTLADQLEKTLAGRRVM